MCSSNAATPSALPSTWTSNTERGFPLLSYLALYPGNDYLCTLPNAEGTYNDVNLGTRSCRVGPGVWAFLAACKSASLFCLIACLLAHLQYKVSGVGR